MYTSDLCFLPLAPLEPASMPVRFSTWSRTLAPPQAGNPLRNPPSESTSSRPGTLAQIGGHGASSSTRAIATSRMARDAIACAARCTTSNDNGSIVGLLVVNCCAAAVAFVTSWKARLGGAPGSC